MPTVLEVLGTNDGANVAARRMRGRVAVVRRVVPNGTTISSRSLAVSRRVHELSQGAAKKRESQATSDVKLRATQAATPRTGKGEEEFQATNKSDRFQKCETF